MKVRLAIAMAAASLLVAGCGTAPTTAARPDYFGLVHSAKYVPARQPQFVDCIFDGFLGSQNMALATHVRQVKRADGYRVDVIAGPFQYVVADIGDDGTYRLIRSKAAALVNLTAEEDASMGCLQKFEATDIQIGPEATPESRRGSRTTASQQRGY